MSILSRFMQLVSPVLGHHSPRARELPPIPKGRSTFFPPAPPVRIKERLPVSVTGWEGSASQHKLQSQRQRARVRRAKRQGGGK